MTVLYNDSRQIWQFRPLQHWNFVPESVYEVSTKFYSSDRLRVIEGEYHSSNEIEKE